MIKKILISTAMMIFVSNLAEAKNRHSSQNAYDLVSQAAARHGVPQWLAHAVIHTESGHNCSARSRSGASGLGQLMPGTARALGVRSVMNCAQNADASIKYLSRFFHQSGGSACGAATAYNRGSLGGCSSYGKKILSRSRKR